ncbi:hypothetical protein GOP47_0009081 [Adiantum capillus-veneris]|uniref:Cytochrome P450 n=1 Tax=Adiantum capillus-veneris TaxID=13818 RepID=A0A9D4V036_ADICA|nr:hypothetical protein GOP47_0009081 [Adiantum capillus-veneris]
MEALWVVGVISAILVPFLYLVWKHHPSYGANPGAPAFPLVGSLPLVIRNKHRFYEWTCELFDRSPSLTRRVTLGRTIFLSTADPQVVHHILKSHFVDYPKGRRFYPFFADLLGNGIFNCDGALWRLQRKVASHVFTTNSLRDFVLAIADAEISGRLLPALDSVYCSSTDFLDLQALLMHYTFDTICQLTFGSDPACLDSSKVEETNRNGNTARMSVTGEDDIADEDSHASHDVSLPTSYAKVPHHLIQGFVQAFQVAVQITAERFLVPGFVWRLKRSLKIGSEKRLSEALEVVNRFTSFVIEQSKKDLANGKDRKDLLARFIRLSKDEEEVPVDIADKNEHEGLSISDALLKDILLSFILAGWETVASGITFALWLLSIHPRVEREVLNEIDRILGDRKFNHVLEGSKMETFTYNDVRKMHYLQAVLSESMRLYPPVPSDCKYAARDDTLPDGTQVLEGYQVSYNVFAMGRAARVWGKDCLEFRPERWLDENGEFVPASPFKYPVFQAGPRICLGKDFAFIQMKLVVASLVRNFEFVVQPGFKPKLSYGVSMIMVDGLPVTIKKRLSSFC